MGSTLKDSNFKRLNENLVQPFIVGFGIYDEPQRS